MIARGINFLLTGWSGRGLLATLLAVAIAIPWLVGDQSYITYLVFTFFVFAVFGHAWNLLAGYCGLLSFGNQVYVGIGGFTLAIIFYYGGISVWLALPISGIVTAAFAFLLATPVRESLVGIGVWKPVAVAGVLWAGYEVALGYFPEADVFGEVYIRRVIILLLIFLGALPLLRLQGAYFAVASWLIAAAVGSIFNEWKVVGAGGGMQIKTDATQIEMYYAGLGLLIFATVVIARLLKSRYGLALTAVRDDEEAAQTSGIDIRKVKLIVFVVAGGLSGLAAGLFYIDAVIITPPAAFTIFWSAYFVFIVVAGGMGTLAGPIIGAAIFVIVDRVLSGVTEYPLLVLGIAAVVIIFAMPRGVMGIVNALRHLDDSATGRNELLEALGIGDRFQHALFLGRRRDTKPGVVAAMLVPGSPLPLLARRQSAVDRDRGRSRRRGRFAARGGSRRHPHILDPMACRPRPAVADAPARPRHPCRRELVRVRRARLRHGDRHRACGGLHRRLPLARDQGAGRRLRRLPYRYGQHRRQSLPQR